MSKLVRKELAAATQPGLYTSQTRSPRRWLPSPFGSTSMRRAKSSLLSRLNFSRDPAGYTLRYDYARPDQPVPADKGLEAAPVPRLVMDTKSGPVTASGMRLDNTRWILDTGANSHLCCNRDLMHSFTEHSKFSPSPGFSGANDKFDSFAGIGDCTIKALIPSVTMMDVMGNPEIQPITLQRVPFFPSEGMNLLSWSALKRGFWSAHPKILLQLVEHDDWSITVCVVEGEGKKRAIMRFKPVYGLYVLEQAD